MPSRPAAAAPAEGAAPAHEPGTITTTQMRRLHALLRDHGISGDKAVHAYINTSLAEHDADPVESRSDLGTVDAARIIAELEVAEVAHAPTAAGLTALRADFPAEEIGQLPRSTCQACSKSERKRCEEHGWVPNCPVCHGRHSSATMHITYVGHADVTARLLSVDPYWTWRPFNPDELAGIPPSMRGDGVWIMLTVLGVTRPGFGSNDGKPGGNGVKEAIGDALRNAAMRFGVALDLWAKGDREWARADKDGTDRHPDEAQPPEPQPSTPYVGPSADEILAQIAAHAGRAGISVEQITAKWRTSNGDLSLDAMMALPPQALFPLERSIADYLAAHPEALAATG